MEKYKIYRYYGGEYPDDIVSADTIAKANKLGQSAEHWVVMEEWYEVAVSYGGGNDGTESIHSEIDLKDAVTYARVYSKTKTEGIDFVFIDKWYMEVNSPYPIRDHSFNAIIIK
jgi:hypothetical protein